MERCTDAVVKTKELTPKQILSVPCNTCGAAIGEACELHTGALRTEPHRDRKLSASRGRGNEAPQAMTGGEVFLRRQIVLVVTRFCHLEHVRPPRCQARVRAETLQSSPDPAIASAFASSMSA